MHYLSLNPLEELYGRKNRKLEVLRVFTPCFFDNFESENTQRSLRFNLSFNVLSRLNCIAFNTLSLIGYLSHALLNFLQLFGDAASSLPWGFSLAAHIFLQVCCAHFWLAQQTTTTFALFCSASFLLLPLISHLIMEILAAKK